VGDENGIVTATSERDGQAFYLNYWELPSQGEG
jgi:hypothetical protein